MCAMYLYVYHMVLCIALSSNATHSPTEPRLKYICLMSKSVIQLIIDDESHTRPRQATTNRSILSRWSDRVDLTPLVHWMLGAPGPAQRKTFAHFCYMWKVFVIYLFFSPVSRQSPTPLCPSCADTLILVIINIVNALRIDCAWAVVSATATATWKLETLSRQIVRLCCVCCDDQRSWCDRAPSGTRYISNLYLVNYFNEKLLTSFIQCLFDHSAMQFVLINENVPSILLHILHIL